MIFVTVGSRQYPFDRLFKKLDQLYETNQLSEPMFAQIGTSNYIPKHYEFTDYVNQSEFMNHIMSADIVLTHGASGSIMKALNAKKKVIAVTRLAKYGEHINDHQIQNNIAFSANHYVLMPKLDLSDLATCFEKIYKHNDKLIPWDNPDPFSVQRMVDNFIRDNW